jgi:hypothetical protein
MGAVLRIVPFRTVVPLLFPPWTGSGILPPLPSPLLAAGPAHLSDYRKAAGLVAAALA